MLQKERSGKRFEDRYWKRLGERPPYTAAEKFFRSLFAVVFLLIGFVLLFIPGPGWLVIFIGAFLFASQSLVIARLLDRLEVRIRGLMTKYRNRH